MKLTKLNARSIYAWIPYLVLFFLMFVNADKGPALENITNFLSALCIVSIGIFQYQHLTAKWENRKG